MATSYHAKSFALLGYRPKIGNQKYPDLPASVAEWYTLVNALELLEKYSNKDAPVSPFEFKTQRLDDKELAIFMYENQGVFWWAFELSANDDPPIFINEDPPQDKWLLCCEKFSVFVYTRLFDFSHFWDDNLHRFVAGIPLETNMLDSLVTEFTPEPITRGGFSKIQYRFSHNDQKILIHTSASGSDWYLSAESPSVLISLSDKLRSMFGDYFPKFNDT